MVTEDIAARVRSYIQHQGTKSHGAIAALVATSQTRYFDIVSVLSDDVASRKPAPEEWSIRELMLHVIDAQDMVAEFVAHMGRGEAPPPSERPRGLGMSIEEDGRSFAALVEQLRAVNTKMQDAITGLPESPDLVTKAPHPFFGDLNCCEWAIFQRVHDEDHVQHAQKILAAIG